MSKLPLRDRLVVLTRPEGRGADWKEALVEAGAAVSELPLLEIKFEPDDPPPPSPMSSRRRFTA